MSLGGPSVIQRGAQSVYRSPHASQSDLKRRFFTCFTHTQKRLVTTDNSDQVKPATLAPLRQLAVDNTKKPFRSIIPLRQLDLNNQQEGVPTLENGPPSRRHDLAAITERRRNPGLHTSDNQSLPEPSERLKLLPVTQERNWGTKVKRLDKILAVDEPDSTLNEHTRLSSDESEDATVAEHFDLSSAHAVSFFEDIPSFFEDIPSDWKGWEYAAQDALQDRLETDNDFSHLTLESRNFFPNPTLDLYDYATATKRFNLELFLNRDVLTFDQAKQLRSIRLLDSDSAEERLRGSQAVLDAVISATLLRPSDPSLFPDVSRDPSTTRRPNRDWVTFFGEKAYDWRRPLEDLLAMSKPLSTQDVERFNAYAEHVRAQRLDGPIIRKREQSMVERPPFWTPENLTQHIYDLTELQLTSKSVFREEHIDWWARTRERILTLLVDDETRPHLSREAIHAAIKFMLRYEFIPDVKRLYDYMDELEIPPTIADWNLWFQHAAKHKSLGHFSNLLSLLKKRGVSVDAYTWAQFFICLESPIVKRVIFEQMRKLKYFHHGPILKLVVPHLIQTDLDEHIDEGGEVADFDKKYDSEFASTEWGSQSTTKVMIATLARRGMVEEVGQVLRTQLRTYPERLLSALTVQELLKMCFKIGNPEGAILLVHLVTDRWNMELTDHSLQFLFRIFYKHCLPNCCRAIWAIMCAQGATTFDLRSKLRSGLQVSPHEIVDPLKGIQSRFDAFENKIIYGRNFMLDWNKIWDDWLMYPDPREREYAFRNVSLAVMLSDKQLHGSWSFRDRLSLILQETFQMDLAWKKQPEVLRGDIKWMMENAYNVPLYPHEGPDFAFRSRQGWFKRVELPSPELHTLPRGEFGSDDDGILDESERRARSEDFEFDEDEDEDKEDADWDETMKEYNREHAEKYVYVPR